eukprot:TRINITY_DN8079_c0_g1_i4.p1 TRINITY_DN8079_c0_g1~~TRINITY_DN8079_c0_g1_i4.p1  ORF type:complete len:311 (-),score=61.97 TRINITY_DN8079_c0_g1_i4:96-1028(-)
MARPITLCFTGCFTCLILVGVILFGCSFAVLELDEVGLKRSTTSNTIDQSQIYFSGRHFIGLTNTFIKYSRRWGIIDFATNGDRGLISGKTNDPSNIQIGVSIMYRIRFEMLPKLYLLYPGRQHRNDMMTSAQTAVSGVINTFSYDDFFKRRDVVQSRMAQAIANAFQRFYCELTLFQLNSIVLENRIEDSILAQEINKRDAITSQQRQSIQVLQGQINVVLASASSDVQKLTSQANAQATEIIAQGQAKGDAKIYDARSSGYKQFLDSGDLGFKENEFLTWLLYDEVLFSPNMTVYAGSDSSVSILTSA